MSQILGKSVPSAADCQDWSDGLLMSEDFVARMGVPKKSLPGCLSSAPKISRGESRSQRLFVKGPIPCDWIAAACRLGKGCAEVSWALWFLHGIKNKYDSRENQSFTLSNKLLKEYGVSQVRKYNALKALERAGLISIIQEPGSLPVVTILYERIEKR